MLFRNDGDAGNDVVVVMGESECDVSALYRDMVGVSKNGFSGNENLEGLLRGICGVDSGGRRLGVNASGSGIWFNGLRGLVAISARCRRRLAGSSLLRSLISFPLLIGGGRGSDLMLGLMTKAEGMDLDFDVRLTRRGFDTSLLSVLECEDVMAEVLSGLEGSDLIVAKPNSAASARQLFRGLSGGDSGSSPLSF